MEEKKKNSEEWTAEIEEDAQKEVLWQEIAEYYSRQKDAKSQDNLVAMLKEIQELYGCIPSEKIPEMSELFGVKESLFLQIIKLYPSLKRSAYSHRITVCTGARCAAAGSSELLAAVRREVEARGGGIFKISMKECLKQCRTAPNMKVDNDFYSSVKAEEIPGILGKYQ